MPFGQPETGNILVLPHHEFWNTELEFCGVNMPGRGLPAHDEF